MSTHFVTTSSLGNTVVAAEKSVLLMANLIEQEGLGYIPEDDKYLLLCMQTLQPMFV